MGQYLIIYCEKTAKNICISLSGPAQDTKNVKIKVFRKEMRGEKKNEQEKKIDGGEFCHAQTIFVTNLPSEHYCVFCAQEFDSANVKCDVSISNAAFYLLEATHLLASYLNHVV